jgi:hypothetical protein
MLPGSPESVGLTLSVTVTVNVWAALVFPELSDAVQLTVVGPRPNVLPDAGEQLTVGLPSTVSVAVGAVQLTTVPPGPVAATEMFPGMLLRVGGVVSTTLTVNCAEPLLPWESLAVQLTVVGPRANVPPEAGVQFAVTLPSTMSDALALYVTVAPDGPVASTLNEPGVVMVGAVVSTTVIVRTRCGPVTSLVTVSVAVQFTSVAPIGNTSPEL